MPLINFKTDLKSLRYGIDRPNGGSSVQPYIQFPIPDTVPQAVSNNALAFFKNYYETNRTSLDFPIRGGQVAEVAGNTYTGTQSNQIDKLRIQNFLKDAPRGTIFIEKQKGLQLTNPNTQVPSSFQSFGFDRENSILPTTRTYNPDNTIAQVAVQGTGKHFNRHGNNPTIYESPQTTYQYIAANTNVPGENRLLLLTQLKLGNDVGFQFSSVDLAGAGLDFLTVDRLNISSIQNQILSYQGGPGSTYGIGRTVIRRATSTVPAKAYSRVSLTYDQVANQNTRQGTDNPLIAKQQDFRNQLVDSKGGKTVASSDYAVYSLQQRLGIGNPGVNAPRVSYTTIIPDAVDKLNAKNLFYYNAETQTPWNANTDNNDTKDIIKFAFECMSNDYPGDAVALVFRAFLDGAIQDNNQGEYASFKYLGRGETFRTYQGYDRSISFAFKLLVQTRSELIPLYKKLNHLISQVYPDYSPQTNFMRGSVVKLTIGDYIYRMPGFIENVNVTLNTDVGWETLLGEYDNTPGGIKDSQLAQLPLVVNVSCNFKPIMDILPRRENYENGYVPLIVNTRNLLNTGINQTGGSATNKELAINQAQGQAQQAASTGRTTPPVQNTPTADKLLGRNSINQGLPPVQPPDTQGIVPANGSGPSNKGTLNKGTGTYYLPKGMGSGPGANTVNGPAGNSKGNQSQGNSSNGRGYYGQNLGG
jgi:hypothetical protein